MADLREQLISDSFPSLLHIHNPNAIGADISFLPPTGLRQVQDGSGVESALLLGRATQGATIVGNLSVQGSTNNIIGNTTIRSTSFVTLSATTENRIIGTSNLIQGNNTINGAVTINGGAITLNGTSATVKSAATFEKTINATGKATLGQLTVGGITYPHDLSSNDSIEPGDDIFVQLNSARNALVFAHINPNDITNNDPLTIMQSDYLNDTYDNGTGSTVALSGFVIDSNWTAALTLPGFNGYKAGIFYLEPYRQLNADRHFTRIIASPTGSNNRIYPVLWVQGGEDAGGGSDPYGVGCQFTCPVVDSKIYFRREMTKRDGAFDPDTDIADEWVLYIIAKLK